MNGLRLSGSARMPTLYWILSPPAPGDAASPLDVGAGLSLARRSDGPRKAQDEQCRHQYQDENRPNVPLLLHDPPFER